MKTYKYKHLEKYFHWQRGKLEERLLYVMHTLENENQTKDSCNLRKQRILPVNWRYEKSRDGILGLKNKKRRDLNEKLFVLIEDTIVK